jgi:hypothetical protein
MTGWMLFLIGRKPCYPEISKKSLVTHYGIKTNVKKSEIPDEDSRVANELIIVT